MNPPRKGHLQTGLRTAWLCVSVASTLLLWHPGTSARAQSAPDNPGQKGQATALQKTAEPANTNTPALPATVEPATQTPGSPAASPPPVRGAASPNQEKQLRMDVEPLSPSDQIQLSFQGANIDLIVQWLAKTTGKSVVKHPKVQCQLTIVSSQKLTVRDAVNLVYRALALEGFVTIETAKSILIVPEGQELKASPELMEPVAGQPPEGRQRLVQVFTLKHVPPGELKEKVRGVLSEKATIEADDHVNKLIVTDFTDNLRLLGKLIEELDLASSSDTVVEIFNLKHSDADEMASLLGLVMNASGGAQGPMPGMPMPGMPMPGQPMLGQPMPGQPMPGQPMAGRPPQFGAPGGSQASQQVRFWPDKTANRLIVAAPKTKLPEVQRLLNLLDVEKPAEVSVRVIPLKNVTAEDLAKEIAPLYQKMSGKSLKDIIEVSADGRSNSLIVLSSEPNFKTIQTLVTALDTEEAQEKVMQAFSLKNADAEDVAKQLQQLAQDQDNSSRYPFYIFSSSGSSNKKRMSVVADRRRNTVIVQAPPAAMEGVAKMIKILDQPVADNTLAPKIIQLKYVSAVDIEDVLNELFLKKQQQRSYYFFDEYPPETPDRDVGRLYGKVRITSEPYSNSIILASNSPENLAAVEEVIKKLDVPSQAGETTLRVGLKFAKASTVANSINILFAKGGSPPLRPTPQPGQPGAQTTPQQQQQQPNSATQAGFDLEQEVKEEGYYPWLGGQPDTTRTTDGRNASRPVSDLVGRVRAVADQRSNALLVSANVHYFPQVLKLIEDLDAPTDQVLIEARIVEVSTAYLDQLGVRWSPNGGTFTGNDLDNSIIASSNGRFTKGFGGPTAKVPFNTTSTTGAGGSSVAAVITSLRSGVVDNSISMDFLVQFLRENTHATVLAEPQINIRDNETGRLFVGQKVPTLTGQVNPSLGGSSQTFFYQDVGVILEVTPHINDMGDVELKIHAESSTVVPGQTILGGAVFDSRAFKTDLRSKNGQTLILGGIIQKQISDIVRKTPLLGDIPGLGWAFKKKDKSIQDVELMVFLRPKIVRTPEDAKSLLNDSEKQFPRIKEWRDNHPRDKKGKAPADNPGQ